MMLITIISFVIMLFKRNRETFYIFMVCLTLAIFIIAELMYIAKKGGISQGVEVFYYLTNEVRLEFQYYAILLKNLGFLLAVGRFLFPLYLILLAVTYSAIPFLRRNSWIKYLFYILPLVSILLYQPDFFKAYIEPFPVIQGYVVTFSYIWPVLYTVVAISLFVFEIISVPIKFTRKYFISIVSFIISLCVLYLLYVRQDPAQVYQFYYSTYEWKHGLHYINTILSMPEYIVYLVIIVIFGVIGLISLSRYTHDILEYSRDERIGDFEFNSVSTANAVFVHSIKNDLLAHQVVLKRLNRALVQEGDIEKALNYHKLLENNQETILEKVNDMYKSLKTNFIILNKIDLLQIFQYAVQQVEKQYPDVDVKVIIRNEISIFADFDHFSEALYNLIVNAIEAAMVKNTTPIIKLKAYTNRLYTIIEVEDNGVGIDKKDLKKIFRPFVSNKNSKNNFGVGLTYVKTIVQEHNGRIHVQSKLNKGTTFYILLPRSSSSERRKTYD